MVTTRPQAAAAAAFLRTLNASWDELGTARVLLDACEDHPLHDVMSAAVRQASNPANRSPNTILWAGDHWPANPSAAAEAKRRDDREEQRAAQQVRALCVRCDARGNRLDGGGRCAHGHDERTDSAETAKAEARAAAAAALHRKRPEENHA